MFARFREDNACFSTLRTAATEATPASSSRSDPLNRLDPHDLPAPATLQPEPASQKSSAPQSGSPADSASEQYPAQRQAQHEHGLKPAHGLKKEQPDLHGSSNDPDSPDTSRRGADELPETVFAARARLLQLPDGRVLSWSEFGHRHGYPVIYFHSPAGSRREAALLHDAARASGFRLIAIDRPGIGFSSYRRLRGHSELVADIRVLLDELDILHAGLLAWAGGGAFALATARHLTERVSFVSLLAPGQPPKQPAGVFGHVAVSALRGLIYLRQGWLRRGLCREPGRSRAPRYLRRLRDRLCYADRKQIDNPLVYHLLVNDVREAGRQGARGVAQDSAMSFMEWDFDPAAVTVPVQLWQGSADTISAPCQARHLQESMPSATLHTVARQGHFFFTQSAADVFRAARQQLRQGREALFNGS